jgi:hypothetical protein
MKFFIPSVVSDRLLCSHTRETLPDMTAVLFIGLTVHHVPIPNFSSPVTFLGIVGTKIYTLINIKNKYLTFVINNLQLLTNNL